MSSIARFASFFKSLRCWQDWHQKLHNNTTPDDVAICEAFIAFLKAKGDNGVYWQVLSDAGKPPQPLSGQRVLQIPSSDEIGRGPSVEHQAILIWMGEARLSRGGWLAGRRGLAR